MIAIVLILNISFSREMNFICNCFEIDESITKHYLQIKEKHFQFIKYVLSLKHKICVPLKLT